MIESVAMTLEEQKAEIDNLTHVEMAKYWRFGNGKKEWYDNTNPIAKHFYDRLWLHHGGFTPQISKHIGW